MNIKPFGLAILLTLTGCSDPPPVSEKKEPVEPVTGQTALYRMYQAARSSWSLDVHVLRMNSTHLAEVPEVPGKAGAWEATFASQTRNRARTYTYSVVESLPSLHKGVFAGPEENVSGTPFLIAAVKVDTDAAYQTALGKAVKYALRENGKPITIFLENSSRFPQPAWRIIWGESLSSASLSVFVDATLGTYLETMH